MKKHIIVFLLCVLSISAYSQEIKIAPKAIPAIVRQSFRAAYPNAKIKGATKETTKGETVYEVLCKDSLANRTISLTSDGKIIETEEDITVDRLPEAVTNAISKQYTKGKIMKIELSVKDSKIVYEVLLKMKRKNTEVAFSPDGTIVKSE